MLAPRLTSTPSSTRRLRRERRCSTDHEELVRVCDRVVIMRRGKAAEILRGDQITADNITAATIGRDTAEPAA